MPEAVDVDLSTLAAEMQAFMEKSEAAAKKGVNRSSLPLDCAGAGGSEDLYKARQA